MNYYRVGIIEPGAKVILPICLKILIILSVIQAGYDISFKLVSGDKIKYMLSVVLKLGLMIFILQNWINGIGLMHALNTGFEMIGYKIGGQGFADLQPDQIVGNGFKVLSLLLETSAKASAWNLVVGTFTTGGISSLFTPIAFIVCIILLFLTAIEMFMARMEFYTMAVLVMPLLPFIMTSKLSFLSEKAISAMFNLAIKCCVIAFLFSAVVPFLNDISEQLSTFKLENFVKAPVLSMQLLIICILLYLLTKRCSALVTGLLNGTPALSGSDMTGALTGAGTKAASAAGQVRAAKAAVVAAGTGGTGALVMALGKNLINRNPITQSYRNGVSSFDDTLNRTSGFRINEMKERINKSNGNSSSESSGNNNKKETREKAKDFAKTVGEKI
jgi:type IV secretion system protein TrbL